MKDWLDKGKHWFKRLFKKEEQPVVKEASVSVIQDSMIIMPAAGIMGSVHPMYVYQHRLKVTQFRLARKRPVFITKDQRYKRRKAEHLRERRDYCRKIAKEYGRVY